MIIETFGSICSGCGYQEMAIKRVFPRIDIKFHSDIATAPNKAYEIIHGNIKQLGDFTQVLFPEYVDFLFASTPCQDFSAIGSQKGFIGNKGNLTWEFIEYLKRSEKLPKIIGFENVTGLLQEQFKEGYKWFKDELKSLGYKVNQYVLNAKNYGTPQNRDRVFLICTQDNIVIKTPKHRKLKFAFKDVAKENGILIPEHILESISKKTGLFGDRFETNNTKIAKCITTKPLWSAYTNNFFTKDFKKYSIQEIRKNNIPVYALNSKAYWLLMGASEEDYHKLKDGGLSDNQISHMSGNGIVVDVLEALFLELKNSYIETQSFEVVGNNIQYCLF
jgi:DNA-cytosine methyltransferase